MVFERIKKWFKDSGKIDSLGSKIIDSLNPFEGIIESSAYPLARIYRTTFWVGIKDTYKIIVGAPYKKGMLDFLIVPALARRLVVYCDRSNSADSNLIWIFKPFGLFVGKTLEIPRLFIGITLTGLASHVVALVHGLSHFNAKKMKNKMNEVGINEEKFPSSGTESDSDYRSLNQSIRLYTNKYGNPFLFSQNKVCEKNAGVIDALLGTNSYGIAQMLEERRQLSEVKETIALPGKIRETFVEEMSNSSSKLKKFKDNKMYDKNVLKRIFVFAGVQKPGTLFREDKVSVSPVNAVKGSLLSIRIDI